MNAIMLIGWQVADEGVDGGDHVNDKSSTRALELLKNKLNCQIRPMTSRKLNFKRCHIVCRCIFFNLSHNNMAAVVIG